MASGRRNGWRGGRFDWRTVVSDRLHIFRFTLTAFLNGVSFGLLLPKKRTIPRVICAVAVTQLCCQFGA